MKSILKGILIYFITLIFLVILQALVIRIPNKYIKDNLNESINSYEGYESINSFFQKFKVMPINNYYVRNSFLIDNRADMVSLNLMWNAYNKDNLYKSQIVMNYYMDGSNYANNLRMQINHNIPTNREYSRYWHGSMIYLKPLFLLFNVEGIKIINYILLFSLTIYLGVLLYKKSKSLLGAFIVGLISINYFVVPYCFEYFFIFLISIVLSIITLKIYNKDNKYFYYLMIISGVSSCFFDFLTCETISLMLPLIIVLYLEYKEGKRNKLLLFIFNSALIWLLSYGITFLIKWILAVLVLGNGEIGIIWKFLTNRVYQVGNNHVIKTVLDGLKHMSMTLFPFNLFNKQAFIVIVMVVIIILLMYILLLDKKQKKYLGLITLIGLIGVVRISVLYSHSAVHPFFDYRNYLGLVIALMLIAIEGVKNEVNYLNTMFKRGKNNRKSNRCSSKVSKRRKVNN